MLNTTTTNTMIIFFNYIRHVKTNLKTTLVIKDSWEEIKFE